MRTVNYSVGMKCYNFDKKNLTEKSTQLGGPTNGEKNIGKSNGGIEYPLNDRIFEGKSADKLLYSSLFDL